VKESEGDLSIHEKIRDAFANDQLAQKVLEKTRELQSKQKESIKKKKDPEAWKKYEAKVQSGGLLIEDYY